MASNTDGQKGYDYKFVEPAPDSLICLICTFVARNPQQSVCCGKIYCKYCLQELEIYSDKCPHCQSDIKIFPDKKSKKTISCAHADNRIVITY